MLFLVRHITPADAVLVLIFVVYNRRRESHIKYPGPDDDVRENIINYDDEGGGEDDMTAFDITPLQIPIGGPMPELANCKMPPIICEFPSLRAFSARLRSHTRLEPSLVCADPVMTLGPGQEPNVGLFIDEHKKRADQDPNAPPFDDLRNYAYEGGGSTAGSLSSLASGEYPRIPPLGSSRGNRFWFMHSWNRHRWRGSRVRLPWRVGAAVRQAVAHVRTRPKCDSRLSRVINSKDVDREQNTQTHTHWINQKYYSFKHNKW